MLLAFDLLCINCVVFSQKLPQLKVSWRRCADLPVPVSAPQVIKIKDYMYVGGGMRKSGDSSTLFQYSLSRDVWTLLPPCPTRQHGLATLDDELITVGGRIQGQAVGMVCTYRDKTWKQVLPDMPTPRYLLSTTSHGNRLILVAGGTTSVGRNGESQRTDVVEIYIKDRYWVRTQPLPFPTSIFSISIVGSRCYILGGATTSDDQSCTTVYCSLLSLLACASPAEVRGEHPTTPCAQESCWRRLQGKHPLIFPSLVQLGGRLVAVGGSWEPMLRHGTRYMSSYEPISDMWVQCEGAELPLPLYRAAVVNLEAEEMMLLGGQSKSQQFSAAVFIGSQQTHHS